MLHKRAILRVRCSFDFKTKCVSVSHQDISITLDQGKISARCYSSSLEKSFLRPPEVCKKGHRSVRINCDDEGFAAYLSYCDCLAALKNICRFCSMLLACSRCDLGRCWVDRQLPSKAICKHPHLRGTFREAHGVLPCVKRILHINHGCTSPYLNHSTGPCQREQKVFLTSPPSSGFIPQLRGLVLSRESHLWELLVAFFWVLLKKKQAFFNLVFISLKYTGECNGKSFIHLTSSNFCNHNPAEIVYSVILWSDVDVIFQAPWVGIREGDRHCRGLKQHLKWPFDKVWRLMVGIHVILIDVATDDACQDDVMRFPSLLDLR